MVDFDVTDLGPADHVEVGESAPGFTRPLVNDEYWEDVALSDLYDGGAGGSPVVLVFHPMDGDFPSTYVWNEIRDRRWGERATVVGCSISSPYEHKRFIEERGLDGNPRYRLFSDPNNGVAEAFGIAHELDGMNGIAEPRPSVFVVDGDGTVEYAWVATEWPAFPDYDDVEDAFEQR